MSGKGTAEWYARYLGEPEAAHTEWRDLVEAGTAERWSPRHTGECLGSVRLAEAGTCTTCAPRRPSVGERGRQAPYVLALVAVAAAITWGATK